jgi:HSP20 family protein
MNDVLSRFSTEGDGGWLTGERIPSLDLSETDGEIEVKMDVPGVKPDEIDIEVRADTLHVRGEHKEEKEEEGKTFHRTERRAGSFSRSVALPCAVDEERVTAECHDGILTISLPKTEDSRTRKVKVQG